MNHLWSSSFLEWMDKESVHFLKKRYGRIKREKEKGKHHKVSEKVWYSVQQFFCFCFCLSYL